MLDSVGADDMIIVAERSMLVVPLPVMIMSGGVALDVAVRVGEPVLGGVVAMAFTEHSGRVEMEEQIVVRDEKAELKPSCGSAEGGTECG